MPSKLSTIFSFNVSFPSLKYFSDFIFPSLDAGNIAYKLCQSLGNFKSYGPFLQGFNKPVYDLSRVAKTDDIISSSVLTLASI